MIFEEDEEKKYHPTLTQQATRRWKRMMSRSIVHVSRNKQLWGLSGYQHNTGQAISVRKDKREPQKKTTSMNVNHLKQTKIVLKLN